MGQGSSLQRGPEGEEMADQDVKLSMQQDDDELEDAYVPPPPPPGYTEERWLADRQQQMLGLQAERERQKRDGYENALGTLPDAAHINRVPLRDPRSHQPTKKDDLNGDAIEYRFPSGSLYVGAFRDGLLHGYGRYLYAPSGDSYEGDWRQDRKHGFGTYVYASGDRYVGEWQQGMKHGKGIYVFRNGDTLRGSWEYDHVCGFAVFFASPEGHASAGGVRFEGEWQQSFRHGFGAQQHLNGNVYEGRWYLGKEDGLGVLQVANDGPLYVGEWRNGLQDSRGIVIENGQKYLTVHAAGALEAKEPISHTAPVPQEFERVHRAYMKWIQRARIDRGPDDDYLPFSLDREGFALLRGERDDWERRYRQLLERVTLSASSKLDGEDWIADKDPHSLHDRLRAAIQHREAERIRADDLEAILSRLRALSAFGPAGANFAASSDRSLAPSNVPNPPAVSSEEVAELQQKLEAKSAALQVLQTENASLEKLREKYNDAHRAQLAQQAQIDELLRELALQRQRATTLQANLDVTGGLGSDAAALGNEVKELRVKMDQVTKESLAWEDKHRKAQTRLVEMEKVQKANSEEKESEALRRCTSELTEARVNLQAAQTKLAELEADYKKERKKHKRAAQDRDEAKLTLLTLETESARAVRQFRIAVGGKMLVLGALHGPTEDSANPTVQLSEDRLGLVIGTSVSKPHADKDDESQQPSPNSADQKIVLDAAFHLSQEQELFDETRFAIRQVVSGLNASVLLWGVDGAASTKETASRLVPRSLDELFNAFGPLQASCSIQCSVSAVEVGASGVVDLLSKGDAEAPVKFMKDSFGTVALHGATAVQVVDPAAANKAYLSAMGRRESRNANAATVMFTVYVRAEHTASKAVFAGKLLFADLCASFSPSAAPYCRQTAERLADVIESLARGRPVELRPNTDPLLIGLSDAIGGNSRSFLVCCASTTAPIGEALQRTVAVARAASAIVNHPMQHFDSAEFHHLNEIVRKVAPDERPPRVFEIVQA